YPVGRGTTCNCRQLRHMQDPPVLEVRARRGRQIREEEKHSTGGQCIAERGQLFTAQLNEELEWTRRARPRRACVEVRCTADTRCPEGGRALRGCEVHRDRAAQER